MKLSIIDTGYFKLDGGAMYGVVPRQMWQKLNPPDQNNMCTWAMRCLLVEEGDKKILIDTGLGNKQDAKFRSHFEPHGEASLVNSLSQNGVAVEEITDVFLTHLHFDHVGGAVRYDKDQNLVPSFPNATYWSNKAHFEWAANPNPRERASMLKENFVPLMEQGRLKFLDTEPDIHFTEGITVDFYNGHTEKLMVPTIHLPNGNKLVYTADLLPSASHAGLPYVMAYDIRPLVTMREKAAFYEKILEEDYYIYFEHDKDNVLGQLYKNERGRYKIKTGLDFENILV